MATALELLRSDVQAHARSITELTTVIMAVKTVCEKLDREKDVEDAVQKKQDEFLERRLVQIEHSISQVRKDFDEKFDKLNKLGWWLIITFGGSIVIGVANFILKGGLTVTTITQP